MRDVNVIAIECMRELENIGIKCGLETIILLKSIKFFLEKIRTLTD